ncbi:hypothetical protein NOVOSPHI9U_50428 [Novosphingobium sp. 9U]|nr:hypothetical protein NOVOSPHI9U_50428 [Novosphingobium sp. 9U]
MLPPLLNAPEYEDSTKDRHARVSVGFAAVFDSVSSFRLAISISMPARGRTTAAHCGTGVHHAPNSGTDRGSSS